MLKHFKPNGNLNNLLSRAIFSKLPEPLTQLTTIKHLTPGGGSLNSPHQLLSTSTSSGVIVDTQEWKRVMSNAEKLTGYSNSLLSLRHIFSDEITNLSGLLRKLLKTKHPLIKMARSLISSTTSESNDETASTIDRRSIIQLNGLIVLLVSRAVGVPPAGRDDLTGMHRLQRSLAEICDMIYVGTLIHKGLVESSQYESPEESESIEQGNKIALLCGDYLLATACRRLAALENTKVVELMSQAIADISEGVFIRSSLNLNSKLSKIKLWYENTYSDSTSLISHSVKSSLLLVRHPSEMQERAWELARNFNLAYRIWCELLEFKDDSNRTINKSGAIVHAIYKDKYEKEVKEEDETRIRKAAAAMASASSASSSSSRVNKKSSPNLAAYSSSLLSTFYPTLAAAKSTSAAADARNLPIVVDDLLYEQILADVKLLFDDHFRLALDSLQALQNEQSGAEAVASLKSMLDLMSSNV